MLKSKANWDILDDAEIIEGKSITEAMFAQRGITSELARQEFLLPKLEDIQSPERFAQIDLAYNRIMQAINEQEHIVIYGDYDADGVTSTAVLVKTITELGGLCEYYIPNRFSEGYGLHTESVQRLSDEGVDLIITVDTGISSHEGAKLSKELSVDLIITDHHEMLDNLPDALAIIHPSTSPDYKFKYLAGVGVALQLASRLLDKIPTHLLDLAAIGTIADLVPLIGENRVIAKHGLKQLEKTEHIGLKALKKACDIEGTVSESDVAFRIAPRINAVGRLQDASLAVELLLSEDEEEAAEIVAEMDKLNDERKQIVETIVNEALEKVDKTNGVIFLYDQDWHEGVLGIAASRLVSLYDRPVVMLRYKEDTNELKGSARSVASFNFFENGSEIRELFTKFGGHSQAAGMTFPYENLAEIQAFFNDKMAEITPDGIYKSEITINHSVKIESLTEELIGEVNTFAPFGMNNEQPIFHFTAVPESVRQIGNDNRHLKIQFKIKNRIVDALGFNMGNLFHFISHQAKVSVVGKLEINVWNGNKTVQMLIEDMCVDEWQLFDFRGKQNHINLAPYFTYYHKNVVVCNDAEAFSLAKEYKNVEIITYESNLDHLLHTDMLYIYDLPNDLTQLKVVLAKIKPESIHISYGTRTNDFLEMMPTREDFKWLYSYLVQYNPVKIRVDISKIMHAKGWTKERVVFLIQVFLDLEFITITDSIVSINPVNEKRELTSSTVYQRKVEEGQIENKLYYSTHDALKEWFINQINCETNQGEEVTS